MVADSAFLFDQVGHPPRGPQTGFVAQSLGPTLQPALDVPQIFRTQTRSASRPSRLLEGPLSAPLELLRPAVHGLPMHSHPAGYFRLRNSLLQQPSPEEASLLQRLKISSNSCWVSHRPTLAEDG